MIPLAPRVEKGWGAEVTEATSTKREKISQHHMTHGSKSRTLRSNEIIFRIDDFLNES